MISLTQFNPNYNKLGTFNST